MTGTDTKLRNCVDYAYTRRNAQLEAISDLPIGSRERYAAITTLSMIDRCIRFLKAATARTETRSSHP